MTKEAYINLIERLIKEELELAAADSFHPHARLNEDLYIDSVMMLELILCLELEAGVSIPDEAISPKDFYTVDSLADFLMRQSEREGATHD
ncbi:petrobactin biosynthesis protein AsbD [Jeotgalibacillus haloalkalitolerans]|uniref:Petrobactin biosynthesis protein AsbD n=1 Tax=Jeotgalibacillus haloalkalitolerans TaxID=3104292 RepID=A0ABU5KIH6_9BACL|nr:petrobactin biosynthesis protein AsbD [Jeotgalibacillus sp. HH7-29]MDZ5710726.1 petrobactin biosynthesis protein AsbD [Jeotgalibacillus sp. HH7-29]